jgi:hypothetical protein
MASVCGCAAGGGGGGGGGGRGVAPDNDNTSDGGPFDAFDCNSPGGEDDGVEFGDPGTTKVIASTLGEGRHLLLDPNWDLIYEFDQPVRFCAVIPDHFTLTNTTTDEEIEIPSENLIHQHLVQGDVVVGSRVSIVPPDGLVAGDDYELVISASGLSLDGDFQVNAGTNLAANGTLPSGDGTAGGDFVQLFRAVELTVFLTDTPAAGGIDLDDQDRLYIVGNGGLFGPFDSPGQVTAGSQLGTDLPQLSNRNVVVTEDGTLIVKENNSEGNVFEVDPTTGLAAQVATAGDLNINPNAVVRAPQGYASIELAGVEQGDIIFADDSGVSALDLPARAGLKGGLHIVERENEISSAYVNLWRPPVAPGKPGEIWGGYKPEEFDDGFEIHRILPNGLVDRFVIPRQLFGFEGTAASHLEDIQGRGEFLILGTLTDSALLPTKQPLSAGFDGVGIYVYDATRDRMQLVASVPLDTFAFVIGAFSQVKLTSDYDRAYISMPSLNVVLALDGLANSDPDGDWGCDDVFDQGVDFGESDARVVASSFGLGRFILEGAPTVVQFEFDRPVPFCSCNTDNITLTNADTGAEVELSPDDVKRIPIYDGMTITASRVMIDLPTSLSPGTAFELRLSGDGFGLDGEFNSSLPSGDGTPGGDFVQRFWIIEGSNFVGETGNAAGIAIDDADRVFVSNEQQVYGPFTTPTEITAADELGAGLPMLSGGGRPLGVDDAGNVVFAGRNNGTVVSIDPDTGVATEIGRNVGGSFEVSLVTAPVGFNGPDVSPGDLIVCNFGRGTVPDLVSGNGATTFFNDSDVSNAYKNFFVPPPDLFGPVMYGSYHVADPLAFTVREIIADGLISDVFARPLLGVSGKAAIRLRDDENDSAQWLILADFEQSLSPQLPTGQIREATDGLELMIYDAGADQLQVLGAVSRGEENAPTLLTVDAEPDFAFTGDLDTVYLTQPVARTVVELTGLGAQ